jgi:molybdate transport system substrate-binding protein
MKASFGTTLSWTSPNRSRHSHVPPRPLKLLSSMATREVLAEIAARYRHDTARSVITEAAGGVDVAKRVQAGEAVDAVVLASNAIDKLIADNKLLPGSRVDLVKSGIAIAVRAGKPKPDIGSEDAVKKAVAAARTVCYSTGPSGVYLEKMFERWGILANIRSRIVVPPPGVPVGSLVATGAAEIGFQQLSELLNVADIEVIGPLPPAIQSITVFSGGISADCGDPEAARALLRFMASPKVSDIKTRHGMEAA